MEDNQEEKKKESRQRPGRFSKVHSDNPFADARSKCPSFFADGNNKPSSYASCKNCGADDHSFRSCFERPRLVSPFKESPLKEVKSVLPEDKKTPPVKPKQQPSKRAKCDPLASPDDNFARAGGIQKQARILETLPSSTRTVMIPIAHGTEPLEVVAIITVLKRGGADVTVASVEDKVGVDTCHGIKMVADTLLSDVTDSIFDLIVLPGGLPVGETLKNCKPLEIMVKKQDTDGRLNAAICCAPALALGTWGLLEGKTATAYPVFMEKLAATCATASESRVEIDGRILTSRGPGTTIEFSITLIEQLFGKNKAHEVASILLVRPNPGEEFTFTELSHTKWSFEDTPQILVPIAEDSEEIEAIALVDILRRAKANVVIVAVGSRKAKLVAEVLLDEVADKSFDLILLPVTL